MLKIMQRNFGLCCARTPSGNVAGFQNHRSHNAGTGSVGVPLHGNMIRRPPTLIPMVEDDLADMRQLVEKQREEYEDRVKSFQKMKELVERPASEDDSQHFAELMELLRDDEIRERERQRKLGILPGSTGVYFLIAVALFFIYPNDHGRIQIDIATRMYTYQTSSTYVKKCL
jgi:hypothetical protein